MMNRKRPAHHAAIAGYWMYGLHPVRAALANPRRSIKRAVLTERAVDEIGRGLLASVTWEAVNADTVGRLLPAGAVHQGAALLCEPLPGIPIEDLVAIAGDRSTVVVLDQITDPHNVGAILRSAAAFGASGVIVQDRHAPPESGSLAKAASGALDVVPYVSVVNIARTLEELGKAGYWRIALAGDGEQTVKEACETPRAALVLGSEGEGLRRLVRERCDVTAFIPIQSDMESLNVSNAAAIALYQRCQT
jgi:23S rRNA (guanosine2251-2'-O)-methyltransferase